MPSTCPRPRTVTVRPGVTPSSVEQEEQLGSLVLGDLGDPHHRGRRPGRQPVEADQVGRDGPAPGDGVAVGAGAGEPEVLVEAVDHLLGDAVDEQRRLAVPGGPIQAEDVDQPALQDPVAAHQVGGGGPRPPAVRVMLRSSATSTQPSRASRCRVTVTVGRLTPSQSASPPGRATSPSWAM